MAGLQSEQKLSFILGCPSAVLTPIWEVSDFRIAFSSPARRGSSHRSVLWFTPNCDQQPVEILPFSSRSWVQGPLWGPEWRLREHSLSCFRVEPGGRGGCLHEPRPLLCVFFQPHTFPWNCFMSLICYPTFPITSCYCGFYAQQPSKLLGEAETRY